MGEKTSSKVKPPTVSFKEVPAGRETLAAIARDRVEVRSSASRQRTVTKHYGDRISNAPGAVSPKVARAMDTSPEVSVTLSTAGRDTYAIIAEEQRHEVPDIEVSTSADIDFDEDEFLDTLEIERLHSFTISGDLEQFNSRKRRLYLVERRLLRQMEGATIDDVTRIEMEETAERGHLLVRIWTRVLD